VHPLTLLGTTGPQLSDTVGGIRLILHVTAAAVWVGGQITVAGLLPTIRGLGGDAPKQVARAFARLMWPAYAVLIVTGFWNISAVGVKDATPSWKVVLVVKIVVVVIAGIAVFLHQRSTSKVGLAVWGSIGGVASIAALCLGVFLAG
jgi:putative copper export protein